jgi:hypothetical protein
VDASTGALVVSDPAVAGGDARPIHAGEVLRVRLARGGV